MSDKPLPNWLRELVTKPQLVKEREERILRKALEYRRAEEPLVDALRRIGLQVESAWDLVNCSRPYPEAIPVLFEHLQRPYPDRVLEGIARALAVPDARPIWHHLADMFRRVDGATAPDLKAGLGCALSAAADDSVIDSLVELASDTKHGGDRLYLLKGLARSRRPEAARALESLRDDPDLKSEIAVLVRRRKRPARGQTAHPRKNP